MAAATMASLPPPPMTTTTTLALITLTLALALPRTRIGRQGGGSAMAHLICCCNGHHCWYHLCLHFQEDSAKDNGRRDRQGRHTNIQGREEVGHHDPIGAKQQQKNKKKNKKKTKKKQKPKPKQKQKQKQKQWQQRHRLCTCRQLRTCYLHCCLCVSRGSSGGSMGVAVAAAGLLRV
jgi:hypothetical protein